MTSSTTMPLKTGISIWNPAASSARSSARTNVPRCGRKMWRSHA
jgi:hypothetical protein